MSVTGTGTLRRKETATLRAGEVTTLDFRFAGGSISGRVTLRGDPVPRASVHVMNLVDTKQQQHLTADAAGTFKVDGVKPGTYKLTARRPQNRRGFSEGAVETIEVAGGEVVCEMAFPSGRLAGRILESGRPFGGAHVQLMANLSREFFKGMRRPGGVDWVPYGENELGEASHEFEFDVLEPGPYYVTVARGKGCQTFLVRRRHEYEQRHSSERL